MAVPKGLVSEALVGLVVMVLALVAGPTAHAKGVVDDAFKPTAEVMTVVSIVSEAMHAPLPQGGQAVPLAPLNTWAQKHLKRPNQVEREEPRAVAHYTALYGALTDVQRQKLVATFVAIGDFGDKMPPRQVYDYILIHGTTVQGMRGRLMSVAQAVARGQLQMTPNTSIVFLDGERPLFKAETQKLMADTAPYPAQKGWRAPDVWPQDERAAAELVWAQLALPDSMRSKTPVFIHAVKKDGARRAETDDTVRAWAERTPKLVGDALMVSENPFIEYQRLVTRSLLHEHGVTDLTLDAMGPEIRLTHVSEPIRIGVLLDNLAGCLHWAAKMQAAGISVY